MNRPSKLAAAASMGASSALFMVVYGGCNWITAHRSDVGTWYYSWERFIPFVPVMIIPYMSIDLFFVAGPFLCHSREELRALARRIAFAILAAGACFLLLPLKIAVACPQVNGWMGALFNFLHGFDQPYNLVPSLHITLRTILADLYARHTRGALRVASHVWFSLIGFSTLLTYQHHVADVIGGFILAAVCFYLFRETSARLPVIPNREIGIYYLAGALACFAAVLSWRPWTGILLWPAASLAIVATAYWWVGPAIYRKTNGRLPLSTRILLAPCLFGQWLSLRHYRRQGDAWDQITPTVWIGAKLSEREAGEAKRQGVTAVLDLTCEFTENRIFLGLTYRNLPILDLTELPVPQLRAAVDFILQHSTRGVVYVHCKAGYSRSAAAVGAFLLATGQAKSVDECLLKMRRVRPSIIFRPEVTVALNDFCASRTGV
ncbi:MAG TPA: phosphatase PAP2/dual specificity phosphatase family protein [Verrucomicrobiae bacterium]|nr:phosphatase PAP2/dual specificity phosphatase family protein [Verrucomicrobiae bacterium]